MAPATSAANFCDCCCVTPHIEVTQASSDRLRGQRVDTAHPNLRGRTDLAFCGRDELADSDVLLFATPHRATMDLLPKLADSARHVIDLSADFRLRDPWLYQQHYGVMHSAPELIDDFVPGLPELGHREALRTADRISVPGCMATAAILALAPIADLVEPEVTVDARTGSSGSGASASTADSHPQRSGAMRVFAPTGHRHEAEIGQATGLSARMTATGVEAVRGVQVVCQAQARNPLTELDLRRALSRLLWDRTVRTCGSSSPWRLPLSGPESAAGLELLRCRLRRRRAAGDRDGGAGQPRQGRRRRGRAMPEHPDGLAGNARAGFSRPASDLGGERWV
ncbi:hypothetical protein [Fodinicola feengrottensis]|nr:hypothetical protein [Fodinicola feengrottensis]